MQIHKNLSSNSFYTISFIQRRRPHRISEIIFSTPIPIDFRLLFLNKKIFKFNEYDLKRRQQDTHAHSHIREHKSLLIHLRR